MGAKKTTIRTWASSIMGTSANHGPSSKPDPFNAQSRAVIEDAPMPFSERSPLRKSTGGRCQKRNNGHGEAAPDAPVGDESNDSFRCCTRRATRQRISWAPIGADHRRPDDSRLSVPYISRPTVQCPSLPVFPVPPYATAPYLAHHLPRDYPTVDTFPFPGLHSRLQADRQSADLQLGRPCPGVFLGEPHPREFCSGLHGDRSV